MDQPNRVLQREWHAPYPLLSCSLTCFEGRIRSTPLQLGRIYIQVGIRSSLFSLSLSFWLKNLCLTIYEALVSFWRRDIARERDYIYIYIYSCMEKVMCTLEMFKSACVLWWGYCCGIISGKRNEESVKSLPKIWYIH